MHSLKEYMLNNTENIKQSEQVHVMFDTKIIWVKNTRVFCLKTMLIEKINM